METVEFAALYEFCKNDYKIPRSGIETLMLLPLYM